jgi:hypothetical protein
MQPATADRARIRVEPSDILAAIPMVGARCGCGRGARPEVESGKTLGGLADALEWLVALVAAAPGDRSMQEPARRAGGALLEVVGRAGLEPATDGL